MTASLLHRRLLPEQVAAYGDLLTVWAHPDDESYLAGGLMAIAAANGARVTCVVATAGEAGGPGDRDHVAALRMAELEVAMQRLGVTEVVTLGLPDGACAAVDPAGPTQAIARVIDIRRPTTVVTFGPDGVTGHPDHRAVSGWTTAALSLAAGPRLLHPATTPENAARFADLDEQFSIYEPGLPITHGAEELALRLDLRGPWLDRKVEALRAHASQTAALIDAVGMDRYADWVADECFVEVAPG